MPLTWRQKIFANLSYLTSSRPDHSDIQLLIHSTNLLSEHGEEQLCKIQPLPSKQFHSLRGKRTDILIVKYNTV